MGEALCSFELLEDPRYREIDLMVHPVMGEPAVLCRRARSFRERLRGLLGTDAGSLAGGVLLIERCTSVHTFGMVYPIDVAFLDRRGVVVASWKNMAPGELHSCRAACAVLERAASEAPWPEPGMVPQFVVGTVS